MLDIHFLFHLFVYICLTVEHFFITYLVIFLDSVFSFFNLRLGSLQDNDPKHAVRVAMECFKSKNINVRRG